MHTRDMYMYTHVHRTAFKIFLKWGENGFSKVPGTGTKNLKGRANFPPNAALVHMHGAMAYTHVLQVRHTVACNTTHMEIFATWSHW